MRESQWRERRDAWSVPASVVTRKIEVSGVVWTSAEVTNESGAPGLSSAVTARRHLDQRGGHG